MSESTGEVPVRQIVQRTNAIHAEAPPPTSTNEDHKKSSLGAKAASIVLGGLALGGSAAVINEVTESGSSAHVAHAAAPEEQKIETTVQAQEKTTVKTHEKIGQQPDLFDTVFHDLNPQQQQEARAWVADFKDRISKKPGYEKEHREIPQQYKEVIENAAASYGLPYEMLYGIIAIENGGGPDITHPVSKATGVAQFLPDTARQYDLIVEGEQDQRKDPVLSIEAAGRYLRDHLALFGNDVGLTIWSYHAGAGNVYSALQVYSEDLYRNLPEKERKNKVVGSLSYALQTDNADARIDVEEKAKALIKNEKLDYYKLVSNQAVRDRVIAGLDDYSETYVPSVLALIALENEKAEREVDLGGGLKIAVPKDAFPTAR